MSRLRMTGLVATVAVLAVALIGFARLKRDDGQPLRIAAAPETGTSDLGARCNSSIDTGTGFGNVTVDTDLVLDHVGLAIDVPCIVHLHHGADFILRTSSVRTRNLVVVDDGPDPGSNVTIDHVSMTGMGAAGLLVQLRHASDSIAVQVSQIDYPLSVWLTTTDTDGTKSPGNIDVNTSSITSVPRDGASASEGIHLVAGGKATFLTDVFRTTSADDDGLAVILGGTGCHQERVVGAVPTCTA
jgi:hypothetical protein